jgi:phosphatidylglycerophosphate synthase
MWPRTDHPFPVFGPANQVTAVRALLTMVVAGVAALSASERTAWIAVGLAVVVTLLDGVDGLLARRSGMASAFGARFDMEVDASLILVLSILVWRHGKAGGWILAAGLLRYVFIASGSIWPWMRRPLPPRRRRQAICVVQIAGLLLALLPLVPQGTAVRVAAISLAALTISFAQDVWWLRREKGVG